jgi:hypothetical protein
MTFMWGLVDLLILFRNLRQLDVSCSGVGDLVFQRITTLQLEYVSLAHTLVITEGILQYLSDRPGTLKELIVVGTSAAVEVGEVAQKLGVKIESDTQGKSMPRVIYS